MGPGRAAAAVERRRGGARRGGGGPAARGTPPARGGADRGAGPAPHRLRLLQSRHAGAGSQGLRRRRMASHRDRAVRHGHRRPAHRVRHAAGTRRVDAAPTSPGKVRGRGPRDAAGPVLGSSAMSVRRFSAGWTALATSLLLTLLHAPARALPPGAAVVDSGQFTVTVGGRFVGKEHFTLFKTGGDSLTALVSLMQLHPGAERTDTLQKSVQFAVDGFDYGLHSYNSVQLFRGQRVTRSIQVNDTTYTSYREVGTKGEGNTFVLPPGRLYVLDPPVFTNLEVVCLNLKNRMFHTRPVTMLMMTTTTDTVVTATVTDLGRDTIRWAGRPVPARHVTLGDANASYDVWLHDDGRMLRLEHSPTQLRVERTNPATPRPPARR